MHKEVACAKVLRLEELHLLKNSKKFITIRQLPLTHFCQSFVLRYALLLLVVSKFIFQNKTQDYGQFLTACCGIRGSSTLADKVWSTSCLSPFLFSF